MTKASFVFTKRQIAVKLLPWELIREQSETISFQPTNCFINPESSGLRIIIHYTGT